MSAGLSKQQRGEVLAIFDKSKGPLVLRDVERLLEQFSQARADEAELRRKVRYGSAPPGQNKKAAERIATAARRLQRAIDAAPEIVLQAVRTLARRRRAHDEEPIEDVLTRSHYIETLSESARKRRDAIEDHEQRAALVSTFADKDFVQQPVGILGDLSQACDQAKAVFGDGKRGKKPDPLLFQLCVEVALVLQNHGIAATQYSPATPDPHDPKPAKARRGGHLALLLKIVIVAAGGTPAENLRDTLKATMDEVRRLAN